MHWVNMAIVRGGLCLFLLSILPIPSALGTVTKSSVVADWPEWVSRAPASSGRWYAVGIAASREEARQAALNELLLSISTSVSVEQWSRYSKVNSQVNQEFLQRSVAVSLPLQIANVTVESFAQRATDFAVLISVSEDDIISGLQQLLSTTVNDAVPQDEVAQLVWSIRYRPLILRALHTESVLQGLNQPEPDLRARLLSLLNQANESWSNGSVRIVPNNSARTFVDAVAAQLPAGSNELLWLQLDLQGSGGIAGNTRIYRQQLQVTLRHAASPFGIVYQATLESSGRGATPQAAKRVADVELVETLQQPMHRWFF